MYLEADDLITPSWFIIIRMFSVLLVRLGIGYKMFKKLHYSIKEVKIFDPMKYNFFLVFY